MEMDPEIEKTIAQVFYDSKKGFGSVEQTYQHARELNPAVARADVRLFISKQEIRQHKKTGENQVNSFVAQLPRKEFQVDLMDMGRMITPRY